VPLSRCLRVCNTVPRLASLFAQSFAADSLLEESGFEPVVPSARRHRGNSIYQSAPATLVVEQYPFADQILTRPRAVRLL
jgi:hypothetical protein